MTPLMTKYLAARDVETVVKEFNKKKMEKVREDIIERLRPHSAKNLEGKNETFFNSLPLKKQLEITNPEKTAINIASRLEQSGYTPASWLKADIEQRKNILIDVGDIISQEMLLSPEIRNQINICFSEMDKSVEKIVKNEYDININDSLLKSNNCLEAFNKIYHDIGIIDCRNSFFNDGLNTITSEKLFNSQAPLETAYAKSQALNFEKIYQKTMPFDLKKAAVEKRADNLGNWKEISEDLSPEQNLKVCNPNYELGKEWRINCQRCVPTYELRARGYDVTALPYRGDNYLSLYPYEVWKDAKVLDGGLMPKETIENKMKEWGDGSRAQITVSWKYGGGHTFVAEQKDGVTHFVDPQTGEMDVSYCFDQVEPGSLQFARIDNLQPSKHILDCVKECK